MYLALFSASFLPSLLIPLTCWVFPAVAMAAFFLYVEREDAPTE
ncbi:photosystem I reaction center subunit VIII [Chroococcidiopsis sp. CCMEE 29]|nr:photosystem I reaction center subunit VIII [Chroococcidiopsis sp. CCMEE 29]